MSSNRKSLVIPVLLITIGTGSLLSTLGIAPTINWVWTLGLAMVGLLSIAISGIDKMTIVVAPFFLVASLLSILRQTHRLTFNVEVPIMVIVSGVLLLIARLPIIPFPNWIHQDPVTKQRNEAD